eukprot:Tbor_TRINITY_DN4825_c0_g1::TRINITY_DN4825_c0_g1_i1::g.1515::m.1515/K07055/TRM12, TYW2; tRNA wybutosine-synthesizing protein 2
MLIHFLKTRREIFNSSPLRGFLYIVTILLSIYFLFIKQQRKKKGNPSTSSICNRKYSSSTPKSNPSSDGRISSKLQSFITAAKKTPTGSQMSQKELVDIYPSKYDKHGHVVVIQAIGGEDTGIEKLKGIAEAFALSMRPCAYLVMLDTLGISGDLRTPTSNTILWVNSQEALRAAYNTYGFIRKKGEGYKKECLVKVAKKLVGDDRPITPEDLDAAESAINTGLSQKRNENKAYYLPSVPFFIDEFPPISPLTAYEEENSSNAGSLITPSFTTHMENQIKYSFDVAKVMFSSGNTEERMRFGTINAKGERVVDMFAGIGYFTIPLAKSTGGRPKEIHALEKNPNSVMYLKLNAMQNVVEDIVKVYCGDNRDVTGNYLVGRCDRVLMGYIPSCKEYIPRAYSFLRSSRESKGCKTANEQQSPVEGTPEESPLQASGAFVERKGTIHYHYLSDKKDAINTLHSDFVEALGCDCIGKFEVANLIQIKSFAPKKFHYVADVVFKLQKK